MKILLRLLICMLSQHHIQSQIIPMEIMAGHKYYYQQFSLHKSQAETRMGFSNVSSLILNYTDSKKSELMSQSYITCSIAKNLKFGLGTFYASTPGLKPSINLQFVKNTKNMLLIIVPRVDLMRHPSFDLMTMAEIKPQISERVRLYLRIQSMFNYNSTQHNRSYQYYRLGLEYKNMQLGLAANTDLYGKNHITYLNLGMFFKLNLK